MAQHGALQGLPAGTLWLNSGRWWWTVRLPGEPKRRGMPLRDPYTKRATTDRKRAVQLACSLWRAAEAKAGLSGDDPEHLTVAGLRVAWLAGERRRAESELATRAVLALGHMAADKVRAPDILALQQSLVKSGLAQRTINRRIAAIVRMFGWGVPRDLVPAENWWGMKSVAPVQGRVSTIGPADRRAVEATLAVCHPTLWRMIVTQWLTGMRSGELCRLRVGDIQRDGEIWRAVIARHKTARKGHVRIVSFGPRAQEVLAPILGRDPLSYLFSPLDDEGRDLKGNKRRADQRRAIRSHYDPHSYHRAIEYAIARAGCEHWHPHQLRHLAGTLARDAAGLDAAQAFLGQRHARVTEVYAEVQAAKADEVAGEIG